MGRTTKKGKPAADGSAPVAPDGSRPSFALGESSEEIVQNGIAMYAARLAADQIKSALFEKSPVEPLFDKVYRENINRVLAAHPVDVWTLMNLAILIADEATDNPRFLETLRKQLLSKGGRRSGAVRQESAQQTYQRIRDARDKRVAAGMTCTKAWLAVECGVDVKTVRKALMSTGTAVVMRGPK